MTMNMSFRLTSLCSGKRSNKIQLFFFTKLEKNTKTHSNKIIKIEKEKRNVTQKIKKMNRNKTIYLFGIGVLLTYIYLKYIKKKSLKYGLIDLFFFFHTQIIEKKNIKILR